MALLEVENLGVQFRLPGGNLQAVNGVSFDVEPGSTLAIVGESGSGKSVTALSILRLNPEPPGEYTSGQIRFEGTDLLRLSERRLRRVRGNDITMIFQDPMTSLNPVATIGAQIAESLRKHEHLSRHDTKARAVAALREVGIANPEARASQYPHQFSGGMRQRVMIASALVCRPKLLIADEPTTALDVTVQAQIVELLQELKERHGMAIVMITHDMGLVAQAADKALVMYAGRPAEIAPVNELFRRPMMPYTVALMKSVPRSDTPRGELLDPIPGSPPDMLHLPPGCAFAPRCPLVQERCWATPPPLEEKAASHFAACVLDPDDVASPPLDTQATGT